MPKEIVATEWITRADVVALLREQPPAGRVKVWLLFAPGVGEWKISYALEAERMLANVTGAGRFNAWAEDGVVWIEYVG